MKRRPNVAYRRALESRAEEIAQAKAELAKAPIHKLAAEALRRKPRAA